MNIQVPITIPAWMLMVIPVVLILIIFTIIFNRNNDVEHHNNATKRKSSINWIEKKDLLYWIIIICLGSISLFTFEYREANEVINHWGFAGTIVSIILAVLAIIYTYYQSATTVDSTKRLEKSAKKVEKATTRVEEATKELENNNISNVMTEFEERLATIIREIQQGIHENITTNFAPLNNFLDLQKGSAFRDESIEILNEEEWKRFLKNYIDKELTSEGITLVYAYYLYINKFVYSHTNTVKWLKSLTNDDMDSQRLGGFIKGQLDLLDSLNVLDYESSENALITRLHKPVLDGMKKIVENPGDSLKNVIVSLDKIFKINKVDK